MRFSVHAIRVAGLSALLVGAAALPAQATAGTLYTLDGQPSSQAAVERLPDHVVCDATDMSDNTFECKTVASLPRPSASAASAQRAKGTFGTLDFYDCSNGSKTYMYTNAAYGGSAYSISGGTGVGGWQNLVAGIDNATSSFWARDGTTTSRWHDYANGGGAYYGNGFSCRAVENLANATMDDAGTANDRFSSYASW